VTEERDFSLLHAYRHALGSIPGPIQWELVALSPEVKLPGREADHSPPASDEFENSGAISSLSWRGS
jgi:hypothetical protein